MSTSSFERDNKELNPITAAIGFNDGANGGFWRVQPRQKTGKDKGQWIEMGAELRAYFKDALGKAAGVSGRAIGSDGTPDGVRVLIQGHADKGIPDGIYRFSTKNVRVAEALLTDEYIKAQGLDASDLPGDIDLDNLPSIDSLERVDITPDDIRLANEGINTPEGKQMSEYKNSPEGQAIARLDEETAANVQQGLGPDDSLSPEQLAAGYGFKETEPGSGKYETSIPDEGAGTETVYTVPTTPDANGKYNVLRTEWTGLNDRSGIRQDSNDYDEGSYDSLADAFKAHAQQGWDAAEAADAAPTAANIDANWSEPDEDGYSRFTTPEGITVSAGPNGWTISDNYGMNAGFSTSNAEVGPNDIEVSKAEVLDELNRTGIDNLVATPEAAEALGLPEGYVARGGDKYIAAYIPDSKDASGLYLREDENGQFYMGGTALYLADYDFRNGLISPYGEYDNKEDALKDMRALAFKVPSGGRPRDLMSRVVRDAMEDPESEDIDIDDLIDEADAPVDGEDLLDVNDTLDASDPEFDLTPVAKENTFANELVGDEFFSRGGAIYKVLGTEEDEDGNVTVTAVGRDGERETFNDDSYPVITKFGKPKESPKAARKATPKAAPTPEPAVSTKPARLGRDTDVRTPEGAAALEDALRKRLAKWDENNDGSPELFDGVKAVLDDPSLSGDQRLQAIADAIADAQLQRMEGNINGMAARENAAAIRGIRTTLEGAGFDTEISRRQKQAKAEEKAILDARNAPAVAPTPTPTAKPATPTTSLPENATKVKDVNDLQYGDILYNKDGVEVGKFLGIQSKGEGNAVTIKVSKNGTVLPVRYDFIVPAYMTREVEEPETSDLSADAPKANAAGFTESMRDSLRGMKRTREDGIGEAYARALNNGRTSTIAKDIDGSWFLEKHDEFNGGIKEVKRFNSLDEALAEGTNFLQNKDPQFDAPAAPTEAPANAPATKKAEALAAGDKIYNANGTSGTVTNVTNDNGKITVNYTDENGESKSKRFLSGADVSTQPEFSIKPVAERSGTPATEEQLAALDEFDALDSEEPIDDEDLRGRLFDAFNSAQDGEELDEGELQDLIDDLNMHFLTSIAAKNPILSRKIDNGADIPAPTMSPEEMRGAKVKGRGGKSDPDASLDTLAEHYPDGGFIDDPADELNGGFVARREDIDGGAAKLEVVVLRTIGNKFKVAYRFTDNTTGETKTFTHYKARESYAAIHAKEYGLDKLFDHFSGKTSPIAPTGTTARAYAKYFGPGRTWEDRLKYWRRDKSRLDPSTMSEAQLERLDRDFGGDVEAMAQALVIQNSKMRTFEEEFAHMASGQDEKLNETTEEILNNKMRSGVASFYAAVERGDTTFAKARYQEMMNLIPEASPELKKLFAKTLRAGLRTRLDATGVTGTARTRALQVNSGVVTNFIINARKQWSIDNDIKLPHVSGTGVKVAKRGDMAVFEDNLGNKYVGTVATLRRKSGPNGYNDFVRMKFKDKDGKIRTLNSDLNAESIKLVDAGTEMDVLDGNAWSRLGNLVFARGKKKGGVDQAQEETDRRKAARQRKGLSWVDPTDPSYNPNLGSDGTSGDETDASFVVPKSGSKPASELASGDTVYGTDGTPLGTITAVKMTSKDGKAIMAVKYRDADGKSKTIAYGVDQMVGPNERGGDDNDPKG